MTGGNIPKLPPFDPAGLKAKLEHTDPHVRLAGLEDLSAHLGQDPLNIFELVPPDPGPAPPLPQPPDLGLANANLAHAASAELADEHVARIFEGATAIHAAAHPGPEPSIAGLGGIAPPALPKAPSVPPPPFNAASINARLEHPDPEIRITALQEIAAHANKVDLLKQITPPAIPGGAPDFDPKTVLGRMPRREFPSGPESAFAKSAMPPPFTPAGALAKMDHPDPMMRTSALAELIAHPEAAPAMLPKITTLAADPDPGVREMSHRVLGQLGPPAVPTLTRGLDPSEPDPVRIAAASGLKNVGPAAAPAVLPLCRCLTSPNESVRALSGLALGNIGAPAVPAMTTALGFSEPKARISAIDALGHSGPAAVAALPQLQQLAANAPPDVRLASLASIAKITGDSSVTGPAMLAAANDPNPAVRTTAITRMGEQMEIARPHAPAMIPHLNDPDPGVRAASALALGRMNASDPTSVAALTRALNDPDPNVRANAGIALHRIGPPAAPALPTLRERLNDPDQRVAVIAKECITKIAG